ncbi:MAG: ATP-binding protein [Terracidiphilus sp.]|nr:ATP-binding protein [Terracidiphilus sp.]
MLLRFSVENWMSFRDEATLNMVATREEQHSDHVAVIQKYGLKLLPVAVIYGANASGKSNLIKALRFAQQFITDPPKADAPIPVKPFLLGRDSTGCATTFRFDLLIGETVYEYRFSLTAKRVMREELKRINATSEVTLFQRGSGGDEFKLSKEVQDEERQHFAFRGTHDNQLYLTNSVSQKLTEFRPVFDWFEKGITVIHPDSRYMGMLEITSDRHPRFKEMTAWLRDLDTGIAAMRQMDVTSESTFPKGLLTELATNLKEGQALPLGMSMNDDGLFLQKKDGKVVVRRLAPVHQSESGKEILFRFADESDGTRRLLDVLPAFLSLEERQRPCVFVIDELDRSLHSNLTRSLLEHYLGQRTDSSQSQLIFTTHDTHLMTQDMFRRDEIWITERDQFGASKLVAFSEFKDVRKDKDIRKSYLQGRMGGVPRIKTSSLACEDEAAVR